MTLLRLGLLDDAVEELAAGAQLRHQVDEPIVLVHVVQLDDARVVHAPQDLDLAPEALDAAHLALLDGLDGEALETRTGARKRGERWGRVRAYETVPSGTVCSRA